MRICGYSYPHTHVSVDITIFRAGPSARGPWFCRSLQIQYNKPMRMQSPDIWTVAQLTRRVKTLLEREVANIWVSGEISNWRVSPAGHAYFNLKDKTSQVDVVMFRGRLSNVRFEPENGLEAVVHGLVTVYEKRGNYQIICEEMQPLGVGALQLAFERLRKKLDEEGLFAEEHKKAIPPFPRRIGVVTSPTGAAVRDILHVLRRRFANVHVVLFPARVQGEGAAADIVEGIQTLDRWGVDVMIVGRGGGSMEDLWPFNEEAVVRAVYDANTPVISAVGHEIDFTLSDFAADLRAPTPSAAAEVVVQERRVLLKRVVQCHERLCRSIQTWVHQLRHRLAIARSSYVLQRPAEVVRDRRQQADELRMRLEHAVAGSLRVSRLRADKAAHSLALLSPENQVRRAADRLVSLRRRLVQTASGLSERYRSRLRPAAGRLSALSPVAILARGYAIGWKLPRKELIREAKQLKRGDDILVMFGKGSVEASVQKVKEKSDGGIEV